MRRSTGLKDSWSPMVLVSSARVQRYEHAWSFALCRHGGGSYAAYMAVDDELLNKVTWKIPNALALIGSRAGDERNAMTASWVTQLSMEPVLVGVSVDNSAV